MPMCHQRIDTAQHLHNDGNRHEYVSLRCLNPNLPPSKQLGESRLASASASDTVRHRLRLAKTIKPQQCWTMQ